MDDTTANELKHTEQASDKKFFGRWKASLALEFNRQQVRTVLAKKEHCGPLVIQKPLYPEGEMICHGIIIHPPGGVAGGDELTLSATLAANTSVLLTTPGAGKWYKANGDSASQHLRFDLAENSTLEWLPQENILFDASQVKFSTDVHLAKEANYAAWEILCFGRLAKGERWNAGYINQNLIIRREQKVIWNECLAVQANDRFFNSLIGMAGNAVCASFVIAAGAIPVELVTQCQQIEMQNLGHEYDRQARYGVSALPQVFSARYIGMSTTAARAYFENIWHILRPWYLNRPAVRPRIWNT